MTVQQSMLLNAIITGLIVFAVIILFGGFGLIMAPFIIVGSILGWVREDRRIRYEEEQQRLNHFNQNRRP